MGVDGARGTAGDRRRARRGVDGRGPTRNRLAQVPAADWEAFMECFRIGAGASATLLISNGAVGISRGVQITRIVSAAQVLGALVGSR